MSLDESESLERREMAQGGRRGNPEHLCNLVQGYPAFGSFSHQDGP